MTQFQQKGFEVVKGFIPPFFSTYLRNYFTLRAQNDPSLGGDSQAPNSHCVYGDPAFDMVMAMSCLLYTSPSPRDMRRSRMPSSA